MYTVSETLVSIQCRNIAVSIQRQMFNGVETVPYVCECRMEITKVSKPVLWLMGITYLSRPAGTGAFVNSIGIGNRNYNMNILFTCFRGYITDFNPERKRY